MPKTRIADRMQSGSRVAEGLSEAAEEQDRMVSHRKERHWTDGILRWSTGSLVRWYGLFVLVNGG